MEKYDVIVVGAGHAGVEASLVCARMNQKVLLITTKLSRISYMACNPSIGGLAKGNLVKEIDVLGGVMGKAADASCLQYKHLNAKKGPAVRGSRAQCDKQIYQSFVQKFLSQQNRITLIEKEVDQLLIEKNLCKGVLLKDKTKIEAQMVILTTGTFMGAVMHIGSEHKKGGRIGDQATYGLSAQLKNLGFQVTRLKTGTPPRLDRESIDWKKLSLQKGDEIYRPFSFFSPSRPLLKQVFCHLTHTNEQTHEVIQKNLKFSPLYSGIIQGTGPRYCPSIEDKVVRFREKKSHQTFLEPETLNGNSIYVQGLSTSLPQNVQEKFIQTIKGLEKAKFLQWGYAVEYDFINPVQIHSTLETKKIQNLFLAGQVNGSSGYEEAASQGLLAGINAVSKILNLPELILSRHESYTGVLIDDLVTKGTKEPYRMLTSRAEHRLLLREDNVAERLFPIAQKYHLLSLKDQKTLQILLEKRIQFRKKLHSLTWSSQKITEAFKEEKPVQIQRLWSGYDLLKRPEFTYKDLEKLNVFEKKEVAQAVEIEIKYEGYIKIQNQMIKKLQKMKTMKLKNIDYSKVQGLSSEAREKLQYIKPHTIEQAQRISGVSPSSIQALIIYAHNESLNKNQNCST